MAIPKLPASPPEAPPSEAPGAAACPADSGTRKRPAPMRTSRPTIVATVRPRCTCFPCRTPSALSSVSPATARAA